MRNKLLTMSAVAATLLMIFAFSQSAFLQDEKSCTGVVESISHGGVNDAVFKINGDSKSFYINRGFETYSANELNSLIGKSVAIQYTEGWNLLGLNNGASKSAVKIESGNKVFFPKKIWRIFHSTGSVYQ